MARIPIAPEWLVEGEDTATCPVCLMVLVQPTIGCPEGHALCKTKMCPCCRHATDESRLQKCRLAEELIGRLWMRCKHGEEPGPPSPPDAPLVKHKKEPLGWSSPDLRKELRRRGVDAEGGGARELAARLEEHLEEHAAGCTESVLRQDAARACLLCAHGEEGPPADGGCLLS
ncbi:hypothetical protein T484DRAFT_1766629 [Baffinella frigidus]|nr:hypothetical protein T484DRAFT_1766629 [Cryptophyta sp. CCMP2293]